MILKCTIFELGHGTDSWMVQLSVPWLGQITASLYTATLGRYVIMSPLRSNVALHTLSSTACTENLSSDCCRRRLLTGHSQYYTTGALDHARCCCNSNTLPLNPQYENMTSSTNQKYIALTYHSTAR